MLERCFISWPVEIEHSAKLVHWPASLWKRNLTSAFIRKKSRILLRSIFLLHCLESSNQVTAIDPFRETVEVQFDFNKFISTR